MAEPNAALGTRLRQCRERRGMGVNELARRSGVPASAISRLETGARTSMSTDNLRKLAVVLDVSSDYLLGLSAEETLDPSLLDTEVLRMSMALTSVPLSADE